MNKSIKSLGCVLVLFFSGHSFANDHVFNKSLLLKLNPASRITQSSCENYFSSDSLTLNVSYTENALNRNGFVYATLVNPYSNISPIYASLNQLGLSDRLSFSKYYHPAVPFRIEKSNVYIYGIYMNRCNNGDVQGGVQFNVNSSNQHFSCLFTTSPWNYCRSH